MGSHNHNFVRTGLYFWQLFRIVFVLFSVYLMHDALYRYGGVFFGSFSEFLPSLSLASIFWCFLALLTTVLIWPVLLALDWFFVHFRLKLRKEHLLLYAVFFTGFAAVFLWCKRLIWLKFPHLQFPVEWKLIALTCIALASFYLAWRLRNKTEIIQERITPLVWLFGAFTVLSLPIVAYQLLWAQPEIVVSNEFNRTFITDRNRPNIILVTFDALTSLNMSTYGYERETTPFISEWAKHSTLFTRLEAESNVTTPTAASLMTGKRLWTHQTYYVRGSRPLKGNVENIALLLKNNGYYNMAFIQNYFASDTMLGISGSFDIAPNASEFWVPTSLRGFIEKALYRLFSDKFRLNDWLLQPDFVRGDLINKALNMIYLGGIYPNIYETNYPVEIVFNRFLTDLDKNLPEPYFAWIHLLPPHDPYNPPELYLGMFGSLSEITTNGEAQDSEKREIEILRASYDEYIRYCDAQFKEFITELKKRDQFSEPLIILSSDHGESFEHGYLYHGGKHLYEQVTNIPLIIKEPDQAVRIIINDVVEQIDIPPTILELAHIPVPSWIKGRSLVPFMRGRELPRKPAFAMSLEENHGRGQQITKGTIAVWDGDYKLIHYLDENKSLLFNITDDPGELNDLFESESEIGQNLLGLIMNNLKRANERIIN